MALANEVIYQNGAIKRFEKPEVCKAIKVANANRWTVSLSPTEWDQREARLKYEYEKNTKSPVPGEDHPVEKSSSVPHTGLVYDQNFEVDRLRQENKDLLKVIEKMEKGNPALKEASSQFNDALLDEQAKKIDEQNHEITRLLSLVEKKENSISRLHYEKSVLVKENEELKKGEIPARYFDKALVDEQSEKIKKLEHEKLDILEMASSCKQTIAELTKEKTNLEDQITILNACKEHNENVGRKQIKRLGKEISKLNSIIHDKNAVLSDVAEELRLTKIREKNLAELGLKYVGENEKLKNELEEKNYLIDMLRCSSREYCEYGIAAEKMIQKMADVIVYGRPVSSKEFEEYRRWANGYRFNPQLPKISEKEEKKFSPVKDTHPTEDSPKEVEMDEILEYVRKALEKGHMVSIDYDKAEEGGDQSATIVECGKDIDDVFEEIKRLCQE